MRVAAVDIGTNSMRLLITDGTTEFGRWERVTGLGRGVDRTGHLADDAIERTLAAMAEFRNLIEEAKAEKILAIATSASRDAANRHLFFDAVEARLGVRPKLISGDEEARFAYVGATSDWEGPVPVMVSDIGGGSTEFVTADLAVSVDIGSVRLTERAIPSRPAPWTEIVAARELVRETFAGLELASPGALLGVAGTWTEIPKFAGYAGVEMVAVDRVMIDDAIMRLAWLTVEETAVLTAPMRAPVILAGLIVAEGVLEAARANNALVSIRDSLDGVAAAMLAEGLA